MDIHGEDSFGLTRDNGILFRHNHMHHMYFNDFTVPSSKALKELEEIDALSKHVIMKGLNDDDPPTSPTSLAGDPRTPPRHVPTSMDYSSENEPSLKLEEDDELGSFAFFRKPSLASSAPSSSHHSSHSVVDDMLPPHHTAPSSPPSSRHDFNFMPSFDLRPQMNNNKSKDNSLSPNGLHGVSPLNHAFNMNHHHDAGTFKNSVTSSVSSLNPPTITNNTRNISTMNNISNMNTFNDYTTMNTITNKLNISININHHAPTNNNNTNNIHIHDIPDPTTMMDDKSAIHLISSGTNNNLEFLDDYITTGSNSSSSPGESPLNNHDSNHEDEEMDSGLHDSTASLSATLTNAALVPSIPSSLSSSLSSPPPPPPPPPPSSLSTNIHRINSAPVHTNVNHHHHHTTNHHANRLHHSTGSLLPPHSTSAPSSTNVSNLSGVDSGYHSLTSSCNIVMNDNNSLVSMDGEPTGIPIVYVSFLYLFIYSLFSFLFLFLLLQKK